MQGLHTLSLVSSCSFDFLPPLAKTNNEFLSKHQDALL
jgi:hypothetical protein